MYLDLANSLAQYLQQAYFSPVVAGEVAVVVEVVRVAVVEVALVAVVAVLCQIPSLLMEKPPKASLLVAWLARTPS